MGEEQKTVIPRFQSRAAIFSAEMTSYAPSSRSSGFVTHLGGKLRFPGGGVSGSASGDVISRFQLGLLQMTSPDTYPLIVSVAP